MGSGHICIFHLQSDLVELHGYVISSDWGWVWGSGIRLLLNHFEKFNHLITIFEDSTLLGTGLAKMHLNRLFSQCAYR